MSNLIFKKINNVKVKAVPTGKVDNRPVLGGNICPNVHANIFACARKMSGKTSVVGHMLEKCISKDTVVVIFCNTILQDDTWIAIVKRLKKRGNPVETYSSIFGENGENHLKELQADLNADAEEREKEEEGVEEEPISRTDEILEYLNKKYKVGQKEEDEKEPKKRKQKYQCPEIVIVFDDISDELKTPQFSKFLTLNRHYKSKIIISSQYPYHILPQARTQINLWLLFAGHSDDKLAEIHKSADLAIPLDQFIKMYKAATKEKYSFLWIDTNRGEFRRNFQDQIEFKSGNLKNFDL